MKHLSIALIAVFLVMLSACNKNESDIEKDMNSGVVLIQNSGYYELTFSNGEKAYFSGYDEDSGDFSDFTFSADSIKPNISYGTGFLISDKGEIATNNHVVGSAVDENKARSGMRNMLVSLKSYLRNNIEELNSFAQNLQQQIEYKWYYDQDFSEEQYYLEAANQQLSEYLEMYRGLEYVDVNNIGMRYVNNISIAYNDTFVTDDKDLHGCVVTATDPDHDLALIQLKDKKTPADKYVFAIPEGNPLEDYTFVEEMMKKVGKDKNERLYMSGFNLGPALAITKDGVKSQFNNGTVSQRSGDRIMYSIPALPGSSGSPVVNHKGELVAVNYAGVNGTQGFNYGIKVNHLRNLLKNK